MRRFLPLFLSFLPVLVSAQEIISEDTTSAQYAEAHIIASFVKSFDHGLSLTFEEEIRTAPAHRSHTTLSLGYAPVKYLSFSAAYVLKLYGNQGWSDVNKFLRHRVNIDATGQVSFGQWKLSLRERLMMDARADEIDLREKNRVDLVLRSRLQAQYSIPNQPLSLIAKMEIFNTLNAKYFGQYINELRPELGLQWKVDKHNALTLAYRYNYVYSRSVDFLDSSTVSLEHDYTHKHIILLTYKFGW
ncbi:MAG: DUF2490 domain-containing protein [Alistipes sp.]|nr:DUF2490 domain-containing protein [Alistipes sp.]